MSVCLFEILGKMWQVELMIPKTSQFFVASPAARRSGPVRSRMASVEQLPVACMYRYSHIRHIICKYLDITSVAIT